MAEHRTTIVEIGEEGFKTSINIGSHNLISDEPESVGGTDSGPSPYELLASALGSCTVITVRMYANLKKWDLKGMKVKVDHRKEESEDGRSKVDIFSREIEFLGDFDENQYKRMLSIADRCPVHKTLSASSQIVTTHVS
jgi:uncharacterized OsmC-like protein